MANAPVVAVAVDASDGAGAGGEVKALAVRLLGMIHGGRDEPVLAPRTGVLKQLLCWESLQISYVRGTRPRVSATGQNISAENKAKTERYGALVANTEAMLTLLEEPTYKYTWCTKLLQY